jgi:hypothetical protein
MVIIILLESASHSGDLVPFRAQVGRGVGYWRGSGEQARDLEVDVEIDVRGDIDWINIDEIENPLPMMLIRGQGIEIQGPVSELNEDGVLSLDLGDGVICLDTTGRQPTKRPRGVRLILSAVEIYPTGT